MIALLGWLVPLSLAQAGIVAVGVWLALRALPRERSRLRHGVAVGALALVTGSLVVTGSVLLIDWRAHVACWSQAAESPGAVSATCRSHGVPVPAGADPVDPAEKPSAVVAWWSESNLLSVPGERAIARTWTDVSGVVGYIWLAVVLLLGVRELRIRRVMRAVRREATPIADERVEAILDELLDDLGVGTAVEIRETRAVGTPCAIRARTPMILFPDRLLSALDRREIRGVLAHELAHVRRGDLAMMALQRAVKGLLCFNPFVHWIAHLAREEQEAACDLIGAEVGTGSRAQYARALLLLEGFRSTPIASVSVPALLGEGQLGRRVERLLARSRTTGSIRAVVVALALAGSLLAGALGQVTLTGASLGSWAVMVEDNQHRTSVSD